MKVKQEVWKRASVTEKVYMDFMARGKDIESARYIGKYLNMQWYNLKRDNENRQRKNTGGRWHYANTR